MFYLTKKLLDTKWKEFNKKAEIRDLGNWQNVFAMFCDESKRYVLDDGIRILVYFHKNSVTSWKEIKKDFDKKGCNKEDCDNWKRL